MEAEAEAEEKRYGDNMTILCAEMKKKLGAGYAAEIEWYPPPLTLHSPLPTDLLANTLPTYSWDAALNLANRVEGMPEAPYHARYLKEIAEYWRKTGGTSEARAYEEVWTFVAGRVLRQE